MNVRALCSFHKVQPIRKKESKPLLSGFGMSFLTHSHQAMAWSPSMGAAPLGVEPCKPAMPHLLDVTARKHNVVGGLNTLVAHDAGIVWLKAMAASPLHRPTAPCKTN